MLTLPTKAVHQRKVLGTGHWVHELSKRHIGKKWHYILEDLCLHTRVCVRACEAFLMCHALLHWRALWGKCFYRPFLTSAACWEHASPNCFGTNVCVPFSFRITTQTMHTHTHNVCVRVCVGKAQWRALRGSSERHSSYSPPSSLCAPLHRRSSAAGCIRDTNRLWKAQKSFGQAEVDGERLQIHKPRL